LDVKVPQARKHIHQEPSHPLGGRTTPLKKAQGRLARHRLIRKILSHTVMACLALRAGWSPLSFDKLLGA